MQILLANGHGRKMRYWGEIENGENQEGTDVIAATSDTANTGRNGTDSACRFAERKYVYPYAR